MWRGITAGRAVRPEAAWLAQPDFTDPTV